MLTDCKYFQLKKAVVYSYEDGIIPKATQEFAFCAKSLEFAGSSHHSPSTAHLSAKDLSAAIAKMETHLSADLSDEALAESEAKAETKSKASDPCLFYMTNKDPEKECPFYRERPKNG